MPKAFTLIELLVVVAILGILMAIAVPAFNGVSKSARAAQAKAFASQLTTYYSGQGVMNMMKAGGLETYPANTADQDCADAKDGALGVGDPGAAATWSSGTRFAAAATAHSGCTWTLTADPDFKVRYITIPVHLTDMAVAWTDDNGVSYYLVGQGKLAALDAAAVLGAAAG